MLQGLTKLIDGDIAANIILEGVANGTYTGLTARATDSAGNPVTYSLTSNAGGRFAIDPATGRVTVADGTLIDYETAHAYSITVKASSASGVLSQAFSIAVGDVNDNAPVFTSGTTVTVPENIRTGTARQPNAATVVYTAHATDADGTAANKTVHYSLGGADAAAFTINAATGAVSFKVSPDYENPTDTDHNNIYNIVVTASDGVHNVDRGVAIAVTDVNDNAPVFTSGTTGTEAENTAASNVVYTAQATDADGTPANNTITYKLGGPDASSFHINSATGAVTFKASPDYEHPTDAGHNNVYNIVVTASDGPHNVTRSVAITVTNVNDNAPVFTSGPTASEAENTAASHVVYTARAVDADRDAVTYSLGGADGGAFTINATTGAITFKASPDYENPTDTDHNNIYNVVVTASDGLPAHDMTRAVAIAVTNTNDPIFTGGATAAATEAENTSAGTVVYTAQAFNPSGVHTPIHYTLGGADAADFNINAATGAITFKLAPDYEHPADAGADNVYDLVVTASNGLAATQHVTITVTDVNDNAPIFHSGTATTVAEGVSTATAVYTAAATDADGTSANNTVSYSLASGVGDNDLFSIDPNSGAVTFNASPNFESPADAGHDNVYDIVVTASDGLPAHDTTRSVVISVTDVPPTTPVDADAATDTILEGAAIGTTVGVTAASSDPNGPAVTYSITHDTSGGGFAIDGSGVVTVADPNLINYETAPSHSYDVTVAATAGTASSSQTFTIAVGDVAPDTPTDDDGATNTVAEGAGDHTTVGITVQALDISGGPVTYSLTDDASGRFAIDPTTGLVFVTAVGATTIDYETAPGHAYSITAQASDGLLTSTKTFSIAVSDVAPSAPVDTDTGTADGVTEGAATGTYAGITASSTDPNSPSSQVAYSLTDSAGGRFAIDSTTGQVSIGPNASLIDYETAPGHAYSITVQASDGNGGLSTSTFSIAVANADPSTPVDSDTGTADGVTEGDAAGTYTGITASSTDPNSLSSQVTYSLTDDAGGRFAIDPTSGVVTISNASLIDYETASGHAYSITVQASDGNGGLSTKIFSIPVADAPPSGWVDGDAGANTVLEGAADGTAVGVTAQASDPNGGTVTYSLTNDAGGAFTIDSSSGVVTVLNHTKVDFENSGGSYLITVQASDGTLSTTQDFTIDVTDVAPSVPVDNDPTAGSGGTVAEGAAAATTVGITALSTDVNSPSTAVTYSLSNDAGGLFDIGPSSGVVFVKTGAVLDYESNPSHSYTITVNASDSTLSSSQSFTIAVTNVPPSAPSDTNGGTVNDQVSTLANDGDPVGITLQATDVNGGAVTYSLTDDSGVTQNAGGLFTIDPNTGVVTVADNSLLAGHITGDTFQISARASDGTNFGPASTFTISAVSNQLSLDLDGSASGAGHAATFVEQAAAPGVAVANTDDAITNPGTPGANTIVSATITLTNAQAGDSLNIGTLPGAIGASTVTGAGTITVTLTGSDTFAHYQTALDQIFFSTSGDAPNTTDRNVNVVVNDGSVNSNTAHATIHVTAVNDAPTLTLGPAGGVSYTENAGPTPLFTTGSVVDPDSPANFAGGGYTVAVTAGGEATDQIVVLGSSGFSVSGSSLLFGGNTIGSISFGAGSATVAGLTAFATTAVVNQLADAFGFQSSSDNPITSDRTVHFTFNDGGNTGTGGAHDSNVVSETVHVTAVNDPPSGADNTVTATEDGSHTFTAADFGFTDVDGNSLQSVTITTVPDVGTLKDGATTLANGAIVPVADITGGQLVYTPAADGNGSPYASFTFQVQDNGGVANGGVDLDPTPNTITINVTEVNNRPTTTSDTLSDIAEDSGAQVIPFAALTGNDSTGPANEANQHLVVSSVSNTVGGSVQIVGNDVIFTPNANFNGPASFDYQVTDDGTTNGAPDPQTSLVAGHVTFNVTAVNDAPVNTVPFATQGIDENGSHVAIGGISFADVDGGVDETVQLSTSHGNLHVTTSGTAAISAGADNSHTLTISGSIADINTALGTLDYTPDSNYTGADTLTVHTDDGGDTGVDPGLTGTATSEADTDTVGINVTAPPTAGLDGQLWYVTRGGDPTANPTFSDNVVGHLNSNGTAITPTQDTGATNTNENDIALDTAAGLYFVATDGFTVESHHTSDGTIAESAPGNGTVDLLSALSGVDALAADPFYATLFVDYVGTTAATSGIREISYDPANGDLTDTGSFLINQVTASSFGQAIDISVDAANRNLYYVDDDGTTTNAIYVVNYANGANPATTADVAPTPTLLSSTSQFPGDGTNGAIESVAVDTKGTASTGDDIVYFLTAPSAGGVSALWYIDESVSTTATQITSLPAPISGDTLTAIGAHAGLTFDPVTRQLYISDQGDSILQGQLSADGHSITTFTQTYTTTQLTGHTPTATPVPGQTVFDVLPTLSVAASATFTEVNPTSTPVTLSGAATVSDPDGYLAGATITITGGFAGDGDKLTYTPVTGISPSSGSVSADVNGNITLSFTGYATAAAYQSLLDSIQFASGDNPDNFGSNLTRTVTWHVNDGAVGDPHSDGNTKTTTINISAADDAPAAQAGSASGSENNDIVGQAAATDVDNTPAQLTYSLVGAAHGTVTISSAGAYIYTPTADYSGADSFTFRASDGSLHSDALISITVNAVNNAPVVTATTLAAVNEDTASPPGATIGSLFSGHFTDIDAGSSFAGIAVSANTADAGTQGVWQYSSDGTNWFAIGSVSDASALALGSSSSVRFVPAANYNGAPPALSVYGLDNTFGGTFTSGGTASHIDASVNGGTTAISDDPTTISTSITAVNDPPVLDLNTADGPGSDNYATSYSIGSAGAAIAPTTVGITDPDNTTIASATVTLTTHDASDALAISGALPGGISATVDTSVPGFVTVNLSGSASLASYQTALHQIVFSTADNSATPLARSVSVVVNDGTDPSNSATTTITVEPDAPPVAVDDTASATEAGGLNNGAPGVNPTGNVITGPGADSDPDGPQAAITVFAVSTGAEGVSVTAGTVGNPLVGTYGTLTLNSDGSYTYIVDNTNAAVQALRTSGQTVTDVFNYSVRDAANISDTAGVNNTNSIAALTVTIHGANDNPTAVADAASVTEAGGLNNGMSGGNSTPTGNALTNDTDPDSVGNGETKTVQGIEAGNHPGDTVTSVLANSVTGAHGSIVIAANGDYTYTVNETDAAVQALRTAAQTITDTFTYTMHDALGATSTSTITVTIHGQNDNPTANPDIANALEMGGTNNGTAGFNAGGNVLSGTATNTSGTVVTVAGAADTDPDTSANGETQTVQGVETAGGGHTTTDVVTGNIGGGGLVGSYGTLTLNSNGSFSYAVDNSNTTVQQLNAGGHVDDQFIYTIHDADGATSTTTLTIHVNGANDAPVASGDGTYTVLENRANSVTTPTLLSNDTDVDTPNGNPVNTPAASLSAVKDTNTAHGGTVVVNSDGTFSVTYAANSNFLGPDSFTYHASDGALASNSATVTLNVTPEVAFIDNNYTGTISGALGSATNPYASIAAFNTANAGTDHPDIIYLRQGTGTYSTTDGIHLTNGETLLGAGVDLNYQLTAGGTVTLENHTSAPTILVTGGAGNDGIHLAQNNTIAGLNVDMNNAAAVAIADNGGTVGNLSISNVSIGVTNSTGKAIDISHGGALSVSLGTLNSTGSATQGVHLGASGAVETGSFSATSGAISGSTGTAFLDGDGSGTANTGGAASISYGGTISSTGTARTIDIEDRTAAAGNVTFSGNISHTSGNASAVVLQDIAHGNITFSGSSDTLNTGTANAIDISNYSGSGTVGFSGAMNIDTTTGTGVSLTGTNTGSTFNFTGGNLTIDATGTGGGFIATGGGTVIVTGTGNHIATATGTALNISNTTIGASNVTFHDISAGTSSSGPANGIILNNTGTSGHLTVTGDGNNAVGGNASGGVIQHTTSDGIVLTNTTGVSFTDMSIHDTGDNGINGTSVSGFTFANSAISNFGNATPLGVNEDGMVFTNLTGTVTIKRDTIGADGHFVLSPNPPAPTNNGIEVNNDNVANINMTVTGTTFQQISNDGIAVQIQRGNGTLIVDGSTGDGVNTFNQINGRAITFASQADNAANGTLNLKVNNNTFTSVGIGARWDAQGGTTLNAAFENNTMTGTTDDAIRSIADPSSSSFGATTLVNATVSGNNFGGGSAFINTTRGATQNILFGGEDATHTGNTGIGGAGVNPSASDGAHLNIDILNNTIAANGNVASAGIYLQASANNGANATVTANVKGNSVTDGPPGPNPIADIVADAVQNGDVIRLEGWNGSPANDPAAFLQGQNTFPSDGVDDFAASSTVSGFSGDTLPTGGPVAGALFAGAGGVASAANTPGEMQLTQAQLDGAVAAAIAHWAAAGLSADQIAALEHVTYDVADISSGWLGESRPGHVTIDVNADGHGWYIDPAAEDNTAFANAATATHLTADAGAAPAGHMDLLTAVMHEMGEQLGLGDRFGTSASDDLMSGFLATGERRLPDSVDAAQADEAALPTSAQAPAGTAITLGTSGNDTINAGTGGAVLFGGAGADTFVFDQHVRLDAPAPITHVADYSAAQGDTFDFSALLASAHASGQPDTALVHVIEDASGAFATLAINTAALGQAAHWVNVAQLGGAHVGDLVDIVIDPSHAPTHLHVDLA